MKKLLISIVIACFCFSICNCASIFHGANQSIPINTIPVGAKATITGGKSFKKEVKTPDSVSLKRRYSYSVKIEKKGYKTSHWELKRKHNWGYFFLDLLWWTGAPIAYIIDYASRAMYGLEPDELNVTLEKVREVEKERPVPGAKVSFREYIAPEISLPPYTGAKSYIAVLDLEAKGDTRKEIASVLSDSLRNAMVDTNRFNVVERAKMDVILKEQGFQLQDCTSSECIVKVGQLLSAEKIVTGSIGKLGQTYSVQIQLTNVETGQIEKTATKRCQCVEDDLFKVIDYVAKKLVIK